MQWHLRPLSLHLYVQESQCSIATTLVKVYYIDTLDEFVRECADKFGQRAIGFQAYIDDFLLEAQGAAN